MLLDWIKRLLRREPEPSAEEHPIVRAKYEQALKDIDTMALPEEEKRELRERAKRILED